MNHTWIKPAFESFDVNGECTAYAGARRVGAGAGGEAISRPEKVPAKTYDVSDRAEQRAARISSS
jgi:hypothetical protein